MNEKQKDLCKTCEHYWQDFLMPDKVILSHSEILDRKSGRKSMDDVVPYLCLKCPFDSYKKKQS